MTDSVGRPNARRTSSLKLPVFGRLDGACVSFAAYSERIYSLHLSYFPHHQILHESSCNTAVQNNVLFYHRSLCYLRLRQLMKEDTCVLCKGTMDRVMVCYTSGVRCVVITQSPNHNLLDNKIGTPVKAIDGWFPGYGRVTSVHFSGGVVFGGKSRP